MTQATYREAIRAALRAALREDDRVFLMGEDVGRYGGAFGVSRGLLEEFGEERVRDTPLSESTFVGAGIGAALAGMRPIVEVMTVNFSLLAMDQLVNNAATLRYMSGGQMSVPLLVRMATGGGKQVAAQHSHSLEHWYAHVPGLKVLEPATVQDARDMVLAGLADLDPVLVFEPMVLYNLEGELDEASAPTDPWKAAVRRAGADVTLVGYGTTVHTCLRAAAALEERGVDAEVIDLRSLRPLDVESLVTSVRKTHRAVVVDEAWKTLGLASELVALLVEHAFYALDAPVERVCGVEVPMPYAGHLEEAARPSAAGVVAAALRTMARPG